MKVRCKKTGNIYEIKDETIHPLVINSALVSAQNRKRLYFTNIGAEQDGLFGDLKCMIPQPKDRGILLKDILEPEVDEKYYLSGVAIEGILKHKAEQKEKGFGFGAVIKKEDEKMNALKCGGKGVDDLVETIVHNTMPRSSKTGKGGIGPLSRNDGKTYCLDTGQTNAVEIVAMRGRGEKGNIEQQLEANGTDKSNSLTTVQKDNLVRQLKPSKESGGQQPFQQNRVYDINGISPCLDTDSCRRNILTQSRIRRLTPVECCRLQTIDDDYFKDENGNFVVSETQVYKCVGNGWTVAVISHIFNYLK
jgi:DNA (cytosine-5)-methyltransferase 3A